MSFASQAVLDRSRHAMARYAVAMFAVTLMGCATMQGGASTAAAVPEALTAQVWIPKELEETAAGWNRGDIDRHLASTADTATTMTRQGPVRGREAAKEALVRGLFRDGKPMQQLRFEQVVVRPLGPDYALVTGKFILYGGGMKDASGWYSLTWHRTATGWEILHDHSS